MGAVRNVHRDTIYCNPATIHTLGHRDGGPILFKGGHTMPGEWSYHAQAIIHGRISGEKTATVMHFAQPGPLDVFNPQEVLAQLKILANAIHDCVLNTLIPAVTSDWTYDHTEVRDMTTESGLSTINDAPVATPGTAGPQGVNVASQLVHVRSGQGGRNGLGRNFFPPAGENVATAGQWDPAALALIAAFCACMAGKFIGAGATNAWRMGVLSRSLFGGLFGNWDTAFHEAIELEPEAIISTMGTRRKGSGS
jgi:hypothetical protein